jgi:Glycosyl hydrolases family 16
MNAQFRSLIAALFATVGGISVASAGTSLPPPSGYTSSELIFEDQFTSVALDTTKWNPWLGDDVYGRWGDQGLLPSPYSAANCNSTCSNSNQIMVDDPFPYGYETNTTGNHLVGDSGYLAEIANPSNYFSNLGYTWVAAAISSYGHAYLPATGGYVQWHARMPNSLYGAWAGLWMLSANGAEMDIQESGFPWGSAPVNNVLASHWQGSGGSQIIQNTGEDLSADYHIYGVEYRPGQSWKVYLDGNLVATWTSRVPTNAAYQVLIDMEIAGPLASGWHTVADPVNHPGPFELDVDNVQIYSLPSASSPSAPTRSTPSHQHK